MHTFAEWVYFQRRSTKGEITMASILIQHTVKNYAEWKKVFDSNAAMRTSNGELSYQIYRDSTDANKLTIMNKWDSLANAQKFAHAPELKAAMEKAGVEGMPNISFLNEA
jgi:quinol monooxygenase YgiN